MDGTIDHKTHRAAVVLAEEMEFDRAAERLQIPIWELQQRIAQLQRQLSLILFASNGNKVELTGPGEVYIEQIRKSRLFSETSFYARL